MEVATGNLRFSSSGYTDSCDQEQAAAPAAARGSGDHTGHAARNDAHLCDPACQRERPKQQEGGLSGSLPHSNLL